MAVFSNEPPVGGAVIDESGHVWIHESDDEEGWVCIHDDWEGENEIEKYWTWELVKADATGELERWDLHTH